MRNNALHLAVFAVAMVVLGLSQVSDAWSHSVKVFAYVEGDKLLVEGYFGRGIKAKECTVEILDHERKRILEGKTDDKGLCYFDLNKVTNASGDVTVVLFAGQGHRAEYKLSAEDLSDSKDEMKKPVTGEVPKIPKKDSAESLLGSKDRAGTESGAAIAEMVQQAVKKEMAPVLKMLARQQRLLVKQQEKGPGIREIVGGIGWIFGIVGVAAFFMSRKSRPLE
ncbi:hypothetical protein ACFL2Q_08770 [Thermodesulfobacteriota bacterium]